METAREEGIPYMRTATWLDSRASRRASCTDATPLIAFDSHESEENSTIVIAKQPPTKAKTYNPTVPLGKRPIKSRSRSNFSTLQNTKKSVSQSQPEFTTISAQISSDGSKNSESSSLENVKPLVSDKAELPIEETTRSITALARQRKDQKLREEKQKQRKLKTGVIIYWHIVSFSWIDYPAIPQVWLYWELIYFETSRS